MCKIHVDFFARAHKQTYTATCAREVGACVPAFYYYPRSRYPRIEAARKIFKRFIITLRSSPSLAMPRDAAGPRGIPGSRGSQEQRAVSSVRASLTARPWHPGDRIRPLRVDHVISWKWKRARARAPRFTYRIPAFNRESRHGRHQLPDICIRQRATVWNRVPGPQWRSFHWKLWAMLHGRARSLRLSLN